MKGKTITICGILTAIIALLGLEAWTLVNDTKDDTISEVIQSYAKRWPILSVLAGILIGHWFWPLSTRRRKK